jgi:hypothetical protein
MEAGEEEVEKGFSGTLVSVPRPLVNSRSDFLSCADLMQAILERYHEEQVWSDKVRAYSSVRTATAHVCAFS